MTVISYFLKRLRALWRSEDIHDEIAEEMRFHIERRTEENLRRKMAPEEARREAERQFGSFSRIKEQGYEVRGGRWLEATWQDLRYGSRILLKSPNFTAIALLVFAIGIGATTAIVSVADALLMRPLPVPHAGRVMTIWQYNRDTGASQEDVAPGNAIDWIKRARSFEAIAMAEPWSINANIAGREPEYLTAARVS